MGTKRWELMEVVVIPGEEPEASAYISDVPGEAPAAVDLYKRRERKLRLARLAVGMLRKAMKTESSSAALAKRAEEALEDAGIAEASVEDVVKDQAEHLLLGEVAAALDLKITMSDVTSPAKKLPAAKWESNPAGFPSAPQGHIEPFLPLSKPTSTLFYMDFKYDIAADRVLTEWSPAEDGTKDFERRRPIPGTDAYQLVAWVTPASAGGFRWWWSRYSPMGGANQVLKTESGQVTPVSTLEMAKAACDAALASLGWVVSPVPPAQAPDPAPFDETGPPAQPHHPLGYLYVPPPPLVPVAPPVRHASPWRKVGSSFHRMEQGMPQPCPWACTVEHIGPWWCWTLGGFDADVETSHAGASPTLEEAKLAVDAVLVVKGWVLEVEVEKVEPPEEELIYDPHEDDDSIPF